ncbi:Uu.00g045670.m01.CDS01 [Anthostomella pinea]|uniref:ditrans,polycis-polyprenyl diphosphate synthase [(2E,6E)-farnesyldiphosphate specific] n=1 Tax=Anthostomella pinea TaxID=933095 RepID=A0AAI8VB34_9PEZI|nr:Uu.00g045670.m01.CDS01 [Anthostomella pinea]
MSFNARDTQLYREDERAGHTKLGVEEREELVKNYLPAPPARERSSSRGRKAKDKSRFGLRKVVKAQLFVFLYAFVHAIFSVYIRMRIAYRAVSVRAVSILNYHHNTPEYVRRDVGKLRRLPEHLSVILTLEDGGSGDNALQLLVNEVSEIAAWCASAGIPQLSIYEKTGLLKRYMNRTYRTVNQKLSAWFGKNQAPPQALATRGASTLQSPNRADLPRERCLTIILVSEDDGREAMVDLTKVLATMVQKEKIRPKDITTDIVDSELSDAVMREPDLLISFEPYVNLQGYPPWPIRLTEIYCEPDNQGVGYQIFLRGLRKYSQATFKIGK